MVYEKQETTATQPACNASVTAAKHAKAWTPNSAARCPRFSVPAATDALHPLADWELRIRQHRVFYEVDEAAARVRIVAVGYKEHNKLFIGGEEFIL